MGPDDDVVTSPPAVVSDIPTTSTTLIGTHDGQFHCDEALAIAMLRLLPQYREATVVRTRDLTKLAQCPIVVDVGAEYVPSRLRFDHHQRGFDNTLGGKFATKLSSAGLVYKHFGSEVIAEVVKGVRGDDGKAAEEGMLALLYGKIYEGFMEHIDGIDNGVTIGEGELRYKIEVRTRVRVCAHFV